MTEFTSHVSSSPVPLSRSPAEEQHRERAIRILTDAYAYDVITEGEFEQRLASLALATSLASIDLIVADLQASDGAGVRHPLAPAPRTPTRRIVCFMGEIRRTGQWSVPEHFAIRAVMGNLEIDLRYAIIPLGCTIDVSAVMASVSFVVAPWHVVDFDVQSWLASVGSAAYGGARGGRTEPHLRIVGSAIMSDVRVRVRAP